MTRVMMALPELDVGGAQILTLNLIREIRKKTPDIQFQILVLEAPHGTYLEEQCRQEEIDVVYLGKGKGFSPWIIPKIIRAIKGFNPNVIHMHKSRLHYFLLPILLSGVKKRLYTVHNLADRDTQNKWVRKLVAFSFCYCGVIPIAISELCRKSIVETYGLCAGAVPCIYNGIDVAKFINPERQNKQKSEKFRIISVGRLSKQKNYPLLLCTAKKAHSQWPELEFFILGDGEQRRSLEDQIKRESEGSYVHLVGNVDNVHQYLWNADVFLMTSDYEGLPLTVLEAMAAGLPIISTKAGGVADVVQEGRNGFLVDCHDEDGLVSALGKLCDDPKLFASFSKESEMLSKQYSLESMAAQYLKIYLE